MTTDTSPLPFAPLTLDGLRRGYERADAEAVGLLSAYGRDRTKDYYLEDAIKAAILGDDLLNAAVSRAKAES